MKEPKAPSCKDCYFHKNLLCALEQEGPCATFRPGRPGEADPAQVIHVRELHGRNVRVHFGSGKLAMGVGVKTNESAPKQATQRCAGLIQRSCRILPPHIREEQLEELLDDIACAREAGKRVWGRTLSIVVFGIPHLALRHRLARKSKGPAR